MKRENFFPKANASQRAWVVKYKQNISVNGATLGMSATEITDEQTLCENILVAIDAANLAKAESKKKNKDKDKAIQNNMELLRPKIKIHKANTGYTTGIGESLGVIGTEISFDSTKAKTIVLLSIVPQGVDIKFTLELCEGGNIYCKRGNEDDFVFLKFVVHPHTIDIRPNLNNVASELREYKVVLVLNDVEVGIPSDTANIKN